MNDRCWLVGLMLAGAVRLAAAPDLPAWTSAAGARQEPAASASFAVGDFGASPDSPAPVTAAIQQAIDRAAAAGGGTLTFAPGLYLTGALFLKSGVHLHVGTGVILRAVNDEAAYPRQPTRVAGIEMTWPAALLNVDDATDVLLDGDGTIDGNGKYWWDKYRTMRHRDYEPRGLRWASDYDAERVRLIVVWRSRDVTLRGLHLRRSGFWTVHVCYAENVTVDGVTIRDNAGPSTDGVDIDSSRLVLVENCDIDNNDDCICLKAGRDWDGLRVNRPTEQVLIRGNTTRHGGGIVSFGSETSGGIRDIVALNNRGFGTSAGLRFKSARTRGGFVENVLIRGVTMENVAGPISFTLDWNPGYSYAQLPKDATNLPPPLREIPAYWRVLTTPVEPPERGFCRIRNITIEDVTATGARLLLDAEGLPAMPLRGIHLRNVNLAGQTAGRIAHARDWTFENVRLAAADGRPLALTDCMNVAAPGVLH